MNKLVWMLLIASVMVACSEPKENLLDVGIPLKMAEYRKEQVSNINYQLSYNIPEELSGSVSSSLVLTLDVHKLDHPLYLDFNAPKTLLLSLKVNGKDEVIDHQQEHLIIDPSLLKLGSNEVIIQFNAGEQSLNRNEDFLYTLLVPDRASTLFPCFDQPNLKATYDLTISTPEIWEALAGGPLKNTSSSEGRKTYAFEKSHPSIERCPKSNSALHTEHP